MSGTLVKSIGFEWMLVGVAITNFLYAPLLFFLRAPPTRDEARNLLTQQKMAMTHVNGADRGGQPAE